MVRNYVKKTKSYTNEQLMSVVAKCASGELNPNKASFLYNIPRTTINNHLQGKSATFTLGRSPALTRNQEEEIVNHLCILSDWAFGADEDSLVTIVRDFVREKKLHTPFKNDTPGPDWIYG